jgi:hypothetical protein
MHINIDEWFLAADKSLKLLEFELNDFIVRAARLKQLFADLQKESFEKRKAANL